MEHNNKPHIKVINANDLAEYLNGSDRPGLVIVYRRKHSDPNNPQSFTLFEDLSYLGNKSTKHQD